MEDTRGGRWGKKTLLAWMASLDSMEARQAIAIIEPLPEDDARFIEGSQKFYTMKTSMHFLDQRMAALGFWVVQTAGVWMDDEVFLLNMASLFLPVFLLLFDLIRSR